MTKLDRVLDALSACAVEIERLESIPNPTDDQQQQLKAMKRESRLLKREANGYQLTLWSVFAGKVDTVAPPSI